jgi:nucleoside-diphosphate-sugar epimerase
MKILILGGTGAMGVHLVNLLSEYPNNQLVVSSRREQSGKNNLTYVQGDAHNIAFLSQLLKERYDVIVDFMNYHTEEFKERYQLLLASCGQYMYLSSSRVYANSDTPITEDSPRLLDVVQDPEYLSMDEYALAKARQEDLLRNSGYVNWTIIRPYITYSENRLQLGVLEKERWLYRALHGRSIVFSEDIATRKTTLTYGLDVAKAMVALIGREGAKGEAFHITCPYSICWNDVLSLYQKTLEKKIGRRPPFFLTEQALNLSYSWGRYQVKYDRLFNRSFDNTKISRFIDVHKFVKPQEGLVSCLEQLCNHPSFHTIGWGTEGKYDRLTHEHASFREMQSYKDRIKYFLFRYIIK